MDYCLIKLSPESKQLCNIVLPWGKCKYQKLHTEVCNRPDIFQGNISEIFEGFDMVHAHIDNKPFIAKNYSIYHLFDLEKVLQKLTEF